MHEVMDVVINSTVGIFHGAFVVHFTILFANYTPIRLRKGNVLQHKKCRDKS